MYVINANYIVFARGQLTVDKVNFDRGELVRELHFAISIYIVAIDISTTSNDSRL